MSVIQKPLTSASGFISPGFSVDLNGNLTTTSINTLGSLLIGGLPFITGNSLANSVTGSSLTSLGILTALHAGIDSASNDVLTVTNAGINTSALTLLKLNNGQITIDPTNSPNNVAIGPVGATPVDITVSGVVYAASTTDSTSTTSGAVRVAGGVGITKNLTVGNNAIVEGEVIIGGQNIKSLAAALAVALS